MSDQKKKSLTIVCPSCAEENNFAQGEHVTSRCAKCSASFYGKKYKHIKYLSAGLVALSSMLGGYAASEIVNEARLPALAEYRLMNLCINGDPRVVERNRYLIKEETCSCIVTKAVEDIDLTWSLISEERHQKWLFESMKEAGALCR